MEHSFLGQEANAFPLVGLFRESLALMPPEPAYGVIASGLSPFLPAQTSSPLQITRRPSPVWRSRAYSPFYLGSFPDFGDSVAFSGGS